MTLREWVRQREITGFPTFSFEDTIQAFPDRSRQVLLNAIQREKKCGRIYSPYKSFYVIVPVHYVTRGSVPPVYYMDSLMHYLGKRYYMGLLSAATFWGAAHQRSQVDYVFVERPVLKGFAEPTDVKVYGLSRFPFEYTVTRNGECGVVRYSNKVVGIAGVLLVGGGENVHVPTVSSCVEVGQDCEEFVKDWNGDVRSGFGGLDDDERYWRGVEFDIGPFEIAAIADSHAGTSGGNGKRTQLEWAVGRGIQFLGGVPDCGYFGFRERSAWDRRVVFRQLL